MIKDIQREFYEVSTVEALNVSVKKGWVTENEKTENDLDAKTKENLLEEARSLLFSVTPAFTYVFRVAI